MSLRGQQGSGRTKLLADTSRFLIVTVGDAPMAVHADSVQGLLTLEEVGSNPAPVVHGQTYHPVDLAARIGISSDPDGSETRVVLLASGSAHGSLCVAQVQGLEEVDRSRVLPLPPQFRGEEREWYRGILLLEDGVALILDLAWLLATDRIAHDGTGDNRRVEAGRFLGAGSEFATGRAA